MTKEFLLSWFNYDKENGQLIWKAHWNRATSSRLIGKIAGNISYQSHTNYRKVMIDDSEYAVHRIIWFLEKNEWPNLVDHIDGNGLNNKIENLRSVNHRVNCQNKKLHRSGRKQGYHFCKDTELWRAQIKIGKKRVHLGRFKTEEEAHQRYLKALVDFNV